MDEISKLESDFSPGDAREKISEFFALRCYEREIGGRE
jgi:hypothetical protein